MIGRACNLFFGVTGTAAAWSFSAESGAHLAALFAGVCTGVWMLTQTAIALRKNRRK